MVCTKFIVPGIPRGKGRPRFHDFGRPYTPKATAHYEAWIAACYQEKYGICKMPEDSFLDVEIKAFFSIPKSASRDRQEAMARGELLPSRKPDVDNIAKAVLDALNGVAYKDDARVVCCTCSKRYGDPARVEVSIREVQT